MMKFSKEHQKTEILIRIEEKIKRKPKAIEHCKWKNKRKTQLLIENLKQQLKVKIVNRSKPKNS